MAKSKPQTQDILALIEADHRKVDQLFEEISSTKGAKKIQECFNQIYKELTLHAEAEELVFYPAMREYDETEDYIEEAEEEHDEAKVLLEEMKSLKPGDDEFQSKLQELIAAVKHHVEEEENEIFPAVREAMEDEELQQLAEEFQQSKAKLEPEVAAAIA
ncbi:MAG TPA: hemerythrin domain-containing protein [Crinalium sp.]|jgi:hemerythrin superfamily protein